MRIHPTLFKIMCWFLTIVLALAVSFIGLNRVPFGITLPYSGWTIEECNDCWPDAYTGFPFSVLGNCFSVLCGSVSFNHIGFILNTVILLILFCFLGRYALMLRKKKLQ